MDPAFAVATQAPQRRARTSDAPSTDAPPIVHEVLGAPGARLDTRTLDVMQRRLGADLREVRVHTDDRAAASARAVNALAYTVGNEIVFDSERYAPGHQEGRDLLAHELVHAVQQGGPRPPALGWRLPIDPPHSPAEIQARRLGVAGQRGVRSTSLQRAEGKTTGMGFYRSAFYANRYFAKNKATPAGWPYDPELADLWAGAKHALADEKSGWTRSEFTVFADRVRDVQESEMKLRGADASGAVDARTGAVLRARAETAAAAKAAEAAREKSAAQPLAEGPADRAPAVPSASARTAIERALKTRDTSTIEAIGDFDAATEAERIELISMLVRQAWVGPGSREEHPLTAIWSSFGASLGAVAGAHLALWDRCRERGAALEDIAPVRAITEQFKRETLRLARANLDQSAQRVNAEMDRYGLSENHDIKTPDMQLPDIVQDPERRRQLEETKMLAVTLTRIQSQQEGLRKKPVGKGGEPFDPARPPLEDFAVGGVSTWQLVKQSWDEGNVIVARILYSNPALYSAMQHGKIGLLSIVAGDPAKHPERMLNDIRTHLMATAGDIALARSNLGGRCDYRTLKPVHAVLRASAPWNEPFYDWVIRHDVSGYEDREFWTDLGIGWATAVVLVAAGFATFGGAPFLALSAAGLGASAVQALLKDEQYRTFAVAYGAQASADSGLVFKGQVDAAEAAALAAKFELGANAVAMIVSAGLHAVALSAPTAIGRGTRALARSGSGSGSQLRTAEFTMGAWTGTVSEDGVLIATHATEHELVFMVDSRGPGLYRIVGGDLIPVVVDTAPVAAAGAGAPGSTGAAALSPPRLSGGSQPPRLPRAEARISFEHGPLALAPAPAALPPGTLPLVAPERLLGRGFEGFTPTGLQALHEFLSVASETASIVAEQRLKLVGKLGKVAADGRAKLLDAYDALRDPRAHARATQLIHTEATRVPGRPDFNAALVRLLERTGPNFRVLPDKVFDTSKAGSGEFVREVTQKGSFRDPAAPILGGDVHGQMTHAYQDLVIDVSGRGLTGNDVRMTIGRISGLSPPQRFEVWNLLFDSQRWTLGQPERLYTILSRRLPGFE